MLPSGTELRERVWGKVKIRNHWDPCPLKEVIRKCQRTCLPGQLPSARGRSGSQSVADYATKSAKAADRSEHFAVVAPPASA